MEDLAITMTGLSLSMNKGFKRVENLIERKIDGLAISTARGFESVESRMATKEDIKNMATKDDLKDLELRVNGKFEGVNNRIDDFVATRVRLEDHDKLKNRVAAIEGKLK